MDPGLIAAILIGIVAAWPLLTRPGLPVFTDLEQHAYRVFEIITALRAGVLYTRWAPNLFHGFGYPVFNFYAPLTYYLGAAYGLFLGEGGPVAGVKLVLVTAPLLGSLGMYAFARLVWGRAAGVAGAAAFVLSPYVVYHTPYLTGRAPELFALATAPLAFWAFTRLHRSPTPGGTALAALLLAMNLLAHNLVPVIVLSLLVGWIAWIAWTWPTPAGRRRYLLSALGALAVGLGLCLFGWLPALLEQSAVQLGNATEGPYLSYRANFVPLKDLLTPASTSDVLLSTHVRFKLGLAQWVLAGLGALALLSSRRRGANAPETYFALTGAALLFLILPISQPVWDRIWLLALLQFPSRLLGPLALVLATLAASAVGRAAQLPRATMGAWASTLAVAACLLSSLPLLNPLPWADFGPVNLQRLRHAELEWEVGTTASNEFLPITVAAAPGPQPSLFEAQSVSEVDKVNGAALPAGASVLVTEHGPLHDQLEIDCAEPFVLRLYTFDFPGWTAYLDGVAVPITPSEPEGWITIEVPAGSHAVLVRLEDTWPRRLGWLGSSLGLLALVGLLGWHFILARQGSSLARFEVQPGTRAPAQRGVWLASGVAVASLALTIGLHSSGWPYSAATFDQPSPRSPLSARWSSGLALLGYDLPQTGTTAGNGADITLYWTAAAPVTANSRVFVHLIGPDGRLWANSDKFHPGIYEDLPTGRWPVGYTLTDAHTAILAPNAPPGEYLVRVGLWNGYTGERVPLAPGPAADVPSDALELPDTIHVN